jgi:cytochrome P450
VLKKGPSLSDTDNISGLGDIMYINLMGQPVVIISSSKIASALWHSRANLYSNRPPLVFAAEMVGWKDFMTWATDGPFHKDQRRLLFQEMGTKTMLDRFTPQIEAKTRDFIRAVLDDPSPAVLLDHIRT